MIILAVEYINVGEIAFQNSAFRMFAKHVCAYVLVHMIMFMERKTTVSFGCSIHECRKFLFKKCVSHKTERKKRAMKRERQNMEINHVKWYYAGIRHAYVRSTNVLQDSSGKSDCNDHS